MAGLPRAIIKKYGVSKKAWAVFRAGRKSQSRTARAVGGVYMAARRKKRSGRVRGFARRAAGSALAPAMGALIYGAGREIALAKLDPLLAKLPLPGVQYADELVMFGLSYALAKGKIPVLNKWAITRSVGRAGMIIEAYRVGASVAPAIVSAIPALASGGR